MFASTDELLFMNGCDHQPVQKDLSAAIETARRLYPDIEFVHSNFEDYVKKVQAEARIRAPVQPRFCGSGALRLHGRNRY